MFAQPRTLQMRIILAIALLQLVVVGLFSFYLLAQQIGNEIINRQVLGHKLVKVSAPSVSQMLAGHPEELAPYLEKLLNDQSVARVSVTDTQGKRIFEKAKTASTLHPLVQWLGTAPLQGRISTELRQDDGRSLGVFSLDLANEPLNEKLHALISQLAYLFMLLLGVDLIAIQLLVRSVMAPLAPLAAMAKEVSQGRWEHSILQTEANASDEVKHLSDAFIESAKTMRRQIKELEATRAQLAEQELKLRNLISSMREVLIELDHEGLITFLNPAWEALTGHAIENSLGKPFADFLPQPKHKAYCAPRHLPNLPPFDLDLELQNPNGRSVWMRMHTTHQYQEGEFRGIVATLEDVTDSLRLQEQQRQHEQELYQLTITDPLTGLFNRRHFDELLENMLHVSQHKHEPLTLMIVDIDGFKFINDTYGHPVGDEVLKAVAQSLEASCSNQGAVARMAGDEFALLLNNSDQKGSCAVGRQIHDRLNQIVIDLPVGRLTIRTTIGFAVAPIHGKTPQDLIRAADVALYHAKNSGRNRVDTLSKERGDAIMGIFSQGFEVRNAIEAGLIQPFMQPIVDLKSRKTVAYEVLTRMRRGEEYVVADDFIPIAEDLGLIREMDLFVIGKALEVVPKNVHLFVNISLSSFYAPEFAQQLRDLLKSPHAMNRSITLEFTERETVEMSDEFIRLFEEIRAESCNVALDDFGVGYSTYSYLRQLRPEFVKIDGSFVLKIKESQEDVKIIQQICELAKIVGARTIAEHIEDEDVIRMLIELGVDYGQGYYFSKPVSVNDQVWLTADLV